VANRIATLKIDDAHRSGTDIGPVVDSIVDATIIAATMSSGNHVSG
jgi:hypothetical protein